MKMIRHNLPMVLFSLLLAGLVNAQNSDKNLSGYASFGLAPGSAVSQQSAAIVQPFLPSSVAFGYCAAPNVSAVPQGPIWFQLNNPASAYSIMNQSGQPFLAGASWAGDTWYAAVYAETGNCDLVTVDTVTGTRTVIGPIGPGITAMAYDWTTYTMFAIAYTNNISKLYKVDLSSGSSTFVGNIGSALYIAMGCSHTGQLYAINPGNDRLYAINKTNGVLTNIGPIGFNANYAQDMEYDNSDSTMYFAAYNNTSAPGQGELRTVNLSTGATTLVGTFDGGMEVTGFAIKNNPVTSYPDDVAVSQIIAPASGPLLLTNEDVTIKVKNWGQNSHSNIPVHYKIGTSAMVDDTLPGPLAPGASVNFTFSQQADLSIPGTVYPIKAFTDLAGDQNHVNDTSIKNVTNICTDDVGAITLIEPISGAGLPSNSQVKVEIKNFGAFDQTNVPVSYKLGNNPIITETLLATVNSNSTFIYTFAQTVDLSAPGTYDFKLFTSLGSDQNHGNDTIYVSVICTPGLNLIYNNGNFITGTGGGANGADISELQNSLNMQNFGFGNSASSGSRLADDFVIPGLQTWTIDAVGFYGYQTGSTTTSTINSVNFRIWQGAPNAGGNVVWGNTTTNRLTSSVFNHVYRVQETSPTNADRPIMINTCMLSTPIILGPGTYWIDWQAGGTTSLTGPWAQPITITGQTITGNALQFTGGAWNPIEDDTTQHTYQGMPFKLYGSILVGIDKNESPLSLHLFPNPNHGQFTVKSNTEILKWSLSNAIGQVVMTQYSGEKELVIDAGSFEKGIYFIQILTKEGCSNRKVMID